MTLEQINLILSYLERTPIQGNEALRFVEIVKVLQSLAKEQIGE